MGTFNQLAGFILAIAAVGVVYGAALGLSLYFNKAKTGVAKKLRKKPKKSLASLKPRQSNKKTGKKKKKVV